MKKFIKFLTKTAKFAIVIYNVVKAVLSVLESQNPGDQDPD